MHCGPPNQNFGWARGPPAAYPAAPPMGSGKRCKLPQRGSGQSSNRSRILLHCMLARRIWLQHFGSLVSIAMSGKMKSQSRLRSNLVSASNLRHIIIVVQNGKLIFVGSIGQNLRPP